MNINSKFFVAALTFNFIDEISLLYDHYILDGEDDHFGVISYFVDYCIKHLEEDMDAPRGKDGWTYRQILKDNDNE
jgi:hypothetical protein